MTSDEPAWRISWTDEASGNSCRPDAPSEHEPVVNLPLDADEVLRVASGLRLLTDYIGQASPGGTADAAALSQIHGLLARLTPVEDRLLAQGQPPRGSAEPYYEGLPPERTQAAEEGGAGQDG